MKYLDEDIEAVTKGLVTIDDLAKDYGVSKETLRRYLNRHGYYLRKVKIKIITPYKTQVALSVQECADTLKLSRKTIERALNGERVKVLEELGIRLEVMK